MINQLICFYIDDQKLLEKYKGIWTKIEGLKNIQLNALPVYDGRYIKTKRRTYADKVYTNFCGLNVSEEYMECKFFTVISIDFVLAYENKHYLQVYLDTMVFTKLQTTNWQMILMTVFLKIRYYKCCTRIELI